MAGRPKTTTASKEMLTTLAGQAVAVGDNTLATGTLTATSTDLGAVTKASGKTTFNSTAQSTDGGIAYASADTYADAAGADLLITRTVSSSSTKVISDQTMMTASSTTSVFALDIEKVNLPTIRVSTERGGATHYEPGAIDGNVASFDAYVEALGPDTHVGLDASVLTVHDELSMVMISSDFIA
jgi:hypothetical protein